MKNIYLSLLMVILAFTGLSQTVIVSEYVDACSGTNPKALELWNPSGVDIDLTVTPIVVEVQTNSNSAWNNITTINTGMLLAGEVIVISNASVGINASTCATKVTTTLSHNGDDAYRITLGATVTDIFGDPSTIDPGSGWSGGGVVTNGGTIEILGGITTGNPAGWTDPSTRFQTVSSCATTTLTGFGFPPGGCPGPPVPTITVNPTSISGLDYVFGAGPSGIDSALVSGSNLTGLVTGSGITNFEFSLDKTTWGAFPAGLMGAVLNVTPVWVYVRLQSGLAVSTYSETLTISSAGATDVTVSLSGEVTAPPVVCTPTLQTLPYNGIVGSAEFIHSSSNPPAAGPAEECGTNFLISYETTPGTDGSDNEFGVGGAISNAGLSSEDFGGQASFQTYQVDVSAVTAVDIIATGDAMGTGIYNTSNEGFAWWYSLDGGVTIDTFFQTTADIDLDASVLALDVTGVDSIIVGFTFEINGGGNGFENMDVQIFETIANPPLITVGSTSMTGFSVAEGAGASATMPNTLEWEFLTDSVSSSNVVNFFEFSGDAGATWNNATLLDVAIPPFPVTSVTPVPVLVRLIGGLTAGTYYDTVVLESTGAATVEVYLQGIVTPAPIATCTDLFFSEYIEGSSSNKCVEIYNPTDTDIDMGAGSYSISRFNNGGTSDAGPWALTGIVPAYGTYVICNGSSDPGFQALADSSGGVFNGITFYNGNDVLALTKAGVNIDVIGQLGNDPGSAWSGGGVSTANQTLIRMASVQAGDNVDGDAFDPSLEWTSLGLNDFSNLGQHTSDCAPFIWTGNVSTDYHTAGNWDKGTVPTVADHAWIPTAPAGGVFPLASADVDVTDVTIKAGASMNIAPTFGLTFSGTVTNDGTLTLESSASGTAWLDDFTAPTASFTGDLTVETFVTAGSVLGQRYFGSPVAAGSVTGLDGTYASGYPLGPITPLPTCDPDSLAAGSAYSNLFQWNEDATFSIPCVQEGWEAISETNILTPGRGYSGWMNDGSIISVTGAPNTGDIDFVTTGTSAPALAGATGWHVLSNPFPSALNINTLAGDFTSAQIYDGSSDAYSGTFLPVILVGNLAVMQGFVAEATGSATFSALESERVAGNEIWQRPDFGHMLTVNVLGNNKGDKSYIYFEQNATDQFDALGDCKKRESDAGFPTLFTMNNGERMSLNGLSSNNMTRSIDLGLLPGANGTFTLGFDGLATFPATSLIFLEDKLTDTWTNIREVEEYTFSANESDDADRFVLHFTAPIEITSTSSTCAGDDASISIDFGQHTVNNNAIEWNYSLERNANILVSALDQNGVSNIVNLDKGTYTLNLEQGAYTLEVLVEIDGAERVNADFEDPIAVEEGTLVNLANLSIGATDYSWTVEGQNYMNTDLSHVFTIVGMNEIILEASNEDCAESKVKTIEVFAKATGIKDAPELDGARVYAQGNQLILDLSAIASVEGYTARVFNLLGQEIEQVELANSITRINVKESGSYFLVQLHKGQIQKVFKVLVK